MIVLGLSGLPRAQEYHLEQNPGAGPLDRRICQGMDSAAALVVDGEIVAAAAEERFTGAKATGAFPARAIGFCLGHAGIGPADVDVVAHGFDHDSRRRYFVGAGDYFDRVLASRTIVDELVRAGWSDVERRFVAVSHHRAHTESAYRVSGFDSALSIVSDAMGEVDSLSVHLCTPDGVRELHRQGLRTSLGLLYSIVTRYLGYTFNNDEYKVMGLSAYGRPEPFATMFRELLAHRDGSIAVGWPHGALSDGGAGYPHAMRFLEELLGVRRRTSDDGEVGQEYADIARAFQDRFSAVLAELVAYWTDRAGQDSLCLSGGTFLNCLANQAIAALPGVRRVFVPPGAGDDGTAVGAALHVAGRFRGTHTPYTGPGYGTDEVAAALDGHRAAVPGISWSRPGPAGLLDAAADDLAADRLIAWFAGRMEFGPRALGNRSILANPAGHDVKNRLNHVVKMREGFRPFAPAVMEEDYAELFEDVPVDPMRFMLCTARVRPDRADRIAGAVHVDGTARVQLVRRADAPLFWELLARVRERTGLGCVINTSFNVRNQPIIADPATAVRSFATMSLDRLYIEGFRVTAGGGGVDDGGHGVTPPAAG